MAPERNHPQEPRLTFHSIPAFLGDKVTIGDKDTIYTVNKVYVDGTEVNLVLAGSNLERYRVKVRELKFVKLSQPSRPRPRPYQKSLASTSMLSTNALSSPTTTASRTSAPRSSNSNSNFRSTEPRPASYGISINSARNWSRVGTRPSAPLWSDWSSSLRFGDACLICPRVDAILHVV